MQQESKTAGKAVSKPITKTCLWGERIDRLIVDPDAFCERHGISKFSYKGIHDKAEYYVQATPWPVFGEIRKGLEIDLHRPILWEQLLFDPQLGLVDMGHLKEWDKRWIINYPERPEGLDTLGARLLWLMGYRGWTAADVAHFGYHSSSWMNAVITGKTVSPSMCAMQDLCLVFGCTYDWMLGGLKHEYPKHTHKAHHRGPRKKKDQ